MASYFIAMLLMVMVTTDMSALREEEAQGRLDNFAAGTVARSRWLLARLAVLAGAAIIICMIADLGVWAIASAQGIGVNVLRLLLGGLNVLAPVMLLLGAGVLLYGARAGMAVAAMYGWIAWSFTVDIVASVVSLNKVVLDTSLLRHITLVPAATPSWRTVGILVAGGVALALMGVALFRGRDLVGE